MGGVGDVYFCEETQNILVDRDSGRKVPNNKFEFKISERVIEVEQGDSAFSNKKFFIEYMGNYNGDDFISAYDISTKFVLKNEKSLLVKTFRLALKLLHNKCLQPQQNDHFHSLILE